MNNKHYTTPKHQSTLGFLAAHSLLRAPEIIPSRDALYYIMCITYTYLLRRPRFEQQVCTPRIRALEVLSAQLPIITTYPWWKEMLFVHLYLYASCYKHESTIELKNCLIKGMLKWSKPRTVVQPKILFNFVILLFPYESLMRVGVILAACQKIQNPHFFLEAGHSSIQERLHTCIIYYVWLLSTEMPAAHLLRN